MFYWSNNTLERFHRGNKDLPPCIALISIQIKCLVVVFFAHEKRGHIMRNTESHFKLSVKVLLLDSSLNDEYLKYMK